MTKQVVNIGTSANKGDGDPLRTAFRKINENFDEVYSDVKQLNSVNFGGGTITSDIIGTVSGTDSTMLVDGNNSKVVGPIESSTWTRPTGDIEIEATADNVVIEAGTTVTMQHVSAQDYVQVSNNGTVIYSDSSIQLKTAGQDIQIGYDVASGDVQIGHSSSQLFVNGTLTVNEFAKIVPPDYDTVARDGLAGLSDGSLIFNTDSNNLEMYVGGVWKNATATDIGDLTDNGSLIPADVSDLTDTTNIIPADVSDLTDTTSIIPNDIGDLLAGGNTGDVVTKTAIGYGWTAPNYFGGAFSDLTSTPTTLAGYGITDGVALTGLSVTVASAGSANLSYNNLTGAFTYTPPDLSSYLTSVAGTVTASLVPDANEAYDLGSNALKFRDLYLSGTSINLGGATITASGATVTLPANSTIGGTDTISTFDGAFGSLTGTPTTIAGYGITDAFDGAFGSLTGTPTTIAGYGITDAFDGDYNSLSNQPTIPSAYTDSDVDTHLNTGSAGSNEVLSWTGSDYDWVAQSGGGAQTRSTATGTTSSLADAAEADLDITGFKSYALLTITTDRAARVRLYVSAATRTADASRAEGVDPTSDAGLIAEVITTGADTVIISPGAYGFNLESSPTTTIPCRVTNKSGGTSTVQVDLNILQLEA
jgi:hypothetical protein